MSIDLKIFPKTPGIYLMKDKGGVILYIGKAKNLQKRVSSYFKREAEERYQIKFLMEKVVSIEFIQTKTEKEAILLEYQKIQEFKPKYNIDLKDNKTFIRVKLSTNHPFPAISVTRRVKKDNAEYFGPYVSSSVCREMIDQVVKFFRLRTCSDLEFRNRSRPCIQYDIGRCTAPCVGYVSRDDYSEQVDEARLFLTGKSRDLIKNLSVKMKVASEMMKYEEAGRFRDIIKGIKQLFEKQNVMKPESGVESLSETDRDVLYEMVVNNLRKKLHLNNLPNIIECVDISNIQGKVASGAVVCFMNGASFKNRYRLFNITNQNEPNDYAMMYEVLERRLLHTEWGQPDLLLVDGGRGHLSVACKVLEDLNVINLPVVAIAKIESSHKKSSDMAQVFLPNRINPVKFKKGDPAMLYLIRIRDEAHRFSVQHFRRRHGKAMLIE